MAMFCVDEKCTKCGLCARLCPARIITTGEDGAPFVPEEKEKHCIACGQCVSFCPTLACSLDFQPATERVVVDEELMPSPESAEMFLRSRRSVRDFKDKPLPRDVVLRILETARYAPTASNSQQVRWVVSETHEKTKEIGAFVIDCFRAEAQKAQQGAYRLGGIVNLWDSGTDIIFRGAPNLAVAIMPADNAFQVDAAIALTYLELAAYANGVACCWAGFFTAAARGSAELRRFVGARDDEAVVGGQMMGYPAIGRSRLLPPRKKIDINWL